MDIGTGIAIVGIWLFPSICALSETVSGMGMWIAIFCAIIMTLVIL